MDPKLRVHVSSAKTDCLEPAAIRAHARHRRFIARQPD
jgi:hypothetical protein